MAESVYNVPLERRRATPVEPMFLNRPLFPVARREGDFARIRVQHWIDLADAALSQDRLAKDARPLERGRKSKKKAA